MKFPLILRILILSLVLIIGGVTQETFAQAQDAQNTEPVPVGSLVIPMDNTNQPGPSGVAFNLRAYGLVNALLQNNIPVKWSIKFNKAKDAEDFAAGATRVAGTGGSSSGTIHYSGGPFIVAPEYAALATVQITSFNNSTPSGARNVTVYQVTDSNVTADIRYTLVHKPKIAIGPDSGNFGDHVDQSVFDEAGIPNYELVPDNGNVTTNTCYTLVTQAHSTSSAFVGNYKNFVNAGGNLLLQCASINTFENDPNGHFQVTNNYSVYGTNDDTEVSGTPVYPGAYMPFIQFIGDLNGNQDGAITDFFSASGNFIHGNLVAVRHNNGTPHSGSSSNANAYIATVSDMTPGVAGGNVFELGGHDYNRGDGNANLGNVNGKRMILNTVFIPVTRPCSNLQVPSVEGYKSVAIGAALSGNGDVNGNGFLDAGDTVVWAVTYINRGQAAASNFQITDVLPVSPAPGFSLNTNVPMTIITGGAGTSASLNASYNGAGNNNLLQAGAVLAPNGFIRITIPAKLNGPTTGTWQNQAHASGVNVAGDVLTDDFDISHPILFAAFVGGSFTPPPGTVNQVILPSIDPTVISTFATTAAKVSVSGHVTTSTGAGILRAKVTVTDAETGVAVTGYTNAFGTFSINGIEVGKLYSVSVSHPNYVFSTGSQAFVVNDAVAGLTFVANPPPTRSR